MRPAFIGVDDSTGFLCRFKNVQGLADDPHLLFYISWFTEGVTEWEFHSE